MKIAILSESPSLPTGFAKTARTLGASLAAGLHDVVCFGVGVFGETFDRGAFPYRIWAAGMPEDDLAARAQVFMNLERPDAIILNYDLITTLVWIDHLTEMGLVDKTVCHLVVDGLPVDSSFLKPLSRTRALVVPSLRVAECVTPQVRCPVRYFPHLVDGATFSPLVRAADEDGDGYVVGCVAQNRPRKQLQQVLLAIQQLKQEGIRCRLRLHTDRLNATRHGGDNLGRLMRTLGIEEDVRATEYGVSFATSPDVLRDEQLAALIRSCDCMLITPTCGGFEYGIIEAQACGVPIVLTKDAGILEEVSGGAAQFVTPALYDYTPYGARAFRLAASQIASGIKALVTDSTRRSELAVAGLANAARYERSAHQHEFSRIIGELFCNPMEDES